MVPYLADPDVTLYEGDALDVLRTFADGSVGSCVTSPPYEDSRPEYPSPSLAHFEEIFRELGRVVDGPLLLNVGRRWRDGLERLWWLELLTRAERAGWPLRDTVVWIKPNANPIIGEIVTNAHEYVFLLGDDFDSDAIRLDYAPDSVARMRRAFISSVSVKGDDRPHIDGRRGMRVAPNPAGARAPSYVVASVGKAKGNRHPAPMPLELAVWLCTLAGSSSVLDPFAGSGTTGLAARWLGREAVLIEQDPDYCAIAAERLSQLALEGVVT